MVIMCIDFLLMCKDFFDFSNRCIEEEKVESAVNVKDINQKDQVLYLWYCFYARQALEKILESEVAKINDKIPIQVNEDLIRRVYDEIKEVEGCEEEKGDD